MLHSLEAYFLANFLVDAALIAAVTRANGCMRMRRIIYGSLLAASYALAIEVVSPRLSHPAIQCLLLAILSMIICEDYDIRRWGSLSIQLAGGALILGGAGALSQSPQRIPAAALGAGLVLVHTVFDIRSQRITTWEVNVLVSLKGRSVCFRALIDTGNRLHEPISGLPVLIAESRLLDELQTGDVSCRRVSFGALGGGGAMKCFRPDAVLIRRGDSYLRAPEVWVASYPGRIPGSMSALAPPSFAVIPGKV